MRRLSSSGRFLRPLFVLPILLLLVGLVSASSTTDPFFGSAVVNPRFTSLTYGVQAFLWWDPNASMQRLDAIRTALFSHVKQTFAWEDIEPLKETWKFSESDRVFTETEPLGLKIVARLSNTPGWARPTTKGPVDAIDTPPANLDDFARYCSVVAERYKGRIAAYQIWNEPNLAREWNGNRPNAAEYVKLLAACADAIRAQDPDAILISAGLSPTGNNDDGAIPDDLYLQEMYDAGFQRYSDVVGIHAPGYSAPLVSPDDAEKQGIHRFFTFRHVEDMRKIMIANGDAARQIAILELGWTTDNVNPAYQWFAVDDRTQGEYLKEAYQYAAENWRPWVGLMSSIYVSDPAWTKADEEYYWSIILPNGRLRHAYITLSNMAKYCGDRIIPPRDPGSPEALGQVRVPLCH